MKLVFSAVLTTAIACLARQAEGQIYDTNNVVVQTFAGSGFHGYLDGVGQQTMFVGPSGIVADTSSNLFVLDGERIRKITPDATVSTFAGGGTGSLPGYGTNISLSPGARSIIIDHANTLMVLCGAGELLRITSDGYVSSTNLGLSGGNSGICVDSENNIYYSVPNTHKIYRRRTNGVWEEFAGSGNAGYADGNGIFSSFYYPEALTADAADNIYVWDSWTWLLRRINQNRDVVTLAGRGGADTDGVGGDAVISSVHSMCLDSCGNVILACGSSIRKMTATTNVTTLAGSFTQTDYIDGIGTAARFSGAAGVSMCQGMIFVADSANGRIRNISFNPSPQPVLPANLQLSTFPGLHITGTVGRTYRIESSPDSSTWSPLATVLLTASPYLWIDRDPVSGKKFYRAFLLP